ncbi:MAG: ABC transporter permease [Acidobacteriaceae bacterium]|nr:ABC transporter permease [Acidobacteriaceae bacterium]
MLYEVGHWKVMNDLVRDTRYAFRALLKTPLATAVGVLALALGIGVNASSLITTSSLVLHPFPYAHLDRIMTVWQTVPKLKLERSPLAPGDFGDLRRENRCFSQLAAYRPWDAALTGAGDPVRVLAARVTPGFFSALSSKPALGRVFEDSLEEKANARVAVVSEGFWNTHLLGSRDAIGKTIALDGKQYTVIGVMPDAFNWPLQTEIWTPLVFDPAETHDRANHDLMAIGLLKPGASRSEASDEAATLAGRLARQFPDTNEGRRMMCVPLAEIADSFTQRFVLLLLGATLFVLLLACANVGNLQLARAASREKEIAIRTALGAGRVQIARQLFMESLLLSLAAGGLGLLLAGWNLDLTRSDISANVLRIVPGLAAMRVDTTVVFATVVLSVAAGLLCSGPAMFQLALRGMRRDLNETLQQRGDSQGAIPAQNRMRSAMVALELALALVLLVGAGMTVKSFERLLDVYQGFDPKNLLTMQVTLPAESYRRDAQVGSFYDRALQHLEEIPGIRAAAISSNNGVAQNLLIEGRPEPRPYEPRPTVRSISAQYFEAMRIPIFNGRSVSTADRATTQRVVVVSQSVARHYWPRENPLGRRIKLNAHSEWLTVVGVSGDVVENWVTGDFAPAAYIPYAQAPSLSAEILIRTPADPLRVAGAARAKISGVDKNLPVYNVETLEKARADERGGFRAAARAMTTYAVIALLLAVTGIYGVLSQFVTARRHDIGVRMALGADRLDVLRMTMWRAAALTIVGVGFGLPLALLLARGMATALFGVVRVDPQGIVVVTAILAASALLASYVPSWRATQIDPMTALRGE